MKKMKATDETFLAFWSLYFEKILPLVRVGCNPTTTFGDTLCVELNAHPPPPHEMGMEIFQLLILMTYLSYIYLKFKI